MSDWKLTIANVTYTVFVTEHDEVPNPHITTFSPIGSSETIQQWIGSASRRIRVRGKSVRQTLPVSLTSPANYGSFFSSVPNPNTDGVLTWVDPSQARYEDGLFATTDGDARLLVTGFYFTIPMESRITGVLLELKRGNRVGIPHFLQDTILSLVKGGLVVGNNKATTWPVSMAWQSFGGAADTWGLSLSPSDVNNNNLFGMTVSALGDVTAKIDAIRMTIYYDDLTLGTVIDGAQLLQVGQSCVLTDDRGNTTNCVLAAFDYDRLKGVSPNKYVDLTLDLIKDQ